MKLTLDFLLITGMIFTGIILVLLLGRKKKEQHHKVLLGIFIAILFVFLFYYAYLHKIKVLFYLTFIISDSVDVFIGSLFLVYVKGVIDNRKNSLRDNLVHFVFPIIYVLFISIPVLIRLINKEVKLNYLDYLEPLLLFTILYSFVYGIYTYFKLIRFQRLVKHNYSSLENRNLDWIKYLVAGALAIFSIDVSTSIFDLIVGDTGWGTGFFTVIPIVFLVAYLGYFGISQSTILIPTFLSEASTIKNLTTSDSTETSQVKYSYNESEMSQLRNKLVSLMQEQKPHLDNDLTLASLASVLDVPDKKLSTLLNQNMQTSFYDYINGLRVEEVKSKMSMPESEKYTLLAIAYDCGFKSKSSFNRIFKKITNLSPSEYRKGFISSDK